MVYYTIPSVGRRVEVDRRCPDCSRPNGVIHSGIHRRSIRDPKVCQVPSRRMKCPWCGRTWTPRPEGIVPEGRHRICLAHRRKSKGKRAWELQQQAQREGRPPEAESLRRLLELLRLEPRPPTVPEELTVLVRRYIHCRHGLLWKINQLLQHVERTWAKVSDDPTDPTNNVTERVIGLTLKIRSKTMRGFKSRRKVLTHAYLASFLRGTHGLCDLRKVI